MSVQASEFLRRRSGTFWIAFAVLCLLAITVGGEKWYAGYVQANWLRLSQQKTHDGAAAIAREFKESQEEVLTEARRISSSADLRKIFLGWDEDSRRQLFALLQQMSLGDELTAEVYDRGHALLAWRGPAAGVQRVEVGVQRETSFVTRSKVYSYLTVTTPIRDMNSLLGTVVLHRLFDVNYPFSNRFINSESFEGTFVRRLAFPVTFEQTARGSAFDGGTSLNVPLHGVTGSVIGYAIVEAPSLVEFQDRIRITADQIVAVLAALLSVVLGSWLWRMACSSRRLLVRLTGITVILWTARYAWLWLGFPSIVFSSDIFDPRIFASPFGWGLARSMGDFLLTSVVLSANISFVAWQFLPRLIPDSGLPKSQAGLTRALSPLFLTALALVFFLFHRGLSAVVRSVVFDSTLVFHDPTSMFPSAEAAVLLLGLLLVAISTVIGSLVVIVSAHRIAVRAVGKRGWGMFPVIVVFGTVSYIFGEFQPEPLLGQFPRAVVFLGLYLLGYYAFLRASRPGEGSSVGTAIRVRDALICTAAAIALTVPQLDINIHEKERDRVELLARELSRPVDVWLTFVVEQAVREMSGEEAVAVLSSGGAESVGRLAFSSWARSVLSREGYNSAVTYFDAAGRVVSSFGIGMRPDPEALRLLITDSLTSASGRRILTFLTRAEGYGAKKNYIGLTALLSAGGVRLGTVFVELSGPERLYSRMSAPLILQASSGERTDRILGPRVISEFVDGVQVATTGESIPRARKLPLAVAASLKADHTAPEQGMWVDEQFDGSHFETFYFSAERSKARDRIFALSLERIGWQWRLFDLLRIVLYYSLVVLVALSVVFLALVAVGVRLRISFRSKLLLAFLTVSLVPILVIAYFNRGITIERATENIVERLKVESSVLRERVFLERASNGLTDSASVARVNDRWAEEVARESGTDFSVYIDGRERGSSKRELFEAEILDRRIGGGAYWQTILEGKDFYVENRAIGSFSYLIGYRPLVTASGRTLGVVGVPTLYKELEIEEEVARRQALLFGAYALVLVAAIFVGSLFANQIASPLRRLIGATRRIAGGELDFRLKESRRDELGELYQAFNNMTEDLKKNREDLVRAEREMAWKEMAKQVAHEIKNPLTPMKLSIQHLRQAYLDNDKRFGQLLNQVVQGVTEQIDALSRIASEFAHFARMPRRREEMVDVNDLLRDTVDLFSQNKGVEFRLQLAAQALTVCGDREELRRAFINVIRNAIQAFGERGTISITSEHSEGAATICIIDTGPGIPESVRGKLFQPAFSTKTDGMGLGLAIVKKTIDDMRGTIEILSEEGRGATVRIVLPLAAPEGE